MEHESQAARDARIRSLWNTLDTRNEGSLDVPGLKNGLAKLDHPLKDADELISLVLERADINHDGRISYDDFRQFVEHTEEHLWGLFRNIDRDQSGNLDKDELKAAYSQAGVSVPEERLDRFFADVDTNHDGFISFEEWRDFLLFIPPDAPNLQAVLAYYATSVKLTSEGDVFMSDGAMQSIGTRHTSLFTYCFGALLQLMSPPPPRLWPSLSAVSTTVTPVPAAATRAPSPLSTRAVDRRPEESEYPYDTEFATDMEDESETPMQAVRLTDFVPPIGYFVAGGVSGAMSRTCTAPFDRLKVYLIAQTGSAAETVQAAKQGAALQATKHSAVTLYRACVDLWNAGGIRSLWAGNQALHDARSLLLTATRQRDQRGEDHT
ncbi:hypothetical protein LTR50_003163 [Elasticomyces elasticus]|nr:hypothetical protein LTR50_003163 [Elasticomyces elasticus]